MSQTFLIWLEFGACAALITLAGWRLSLYGDVIAEKTGLGGTWIGVVLLASVTSLPELATGVSAVAAADAPNIAVGNILGACVLNLTYLVVLDLVHREESIYTKARQGHILSAGFCVLLLGFIGFSLLLAQRIDGLSLGHVGIYSPAIVVLYLLFMRVVFSYEKKQMAAYVEEAAERYPHLTLTQAIVRFLLAALVVVGTGTWLPFVGEDIAGLYDWNTSFVGALFIAAATSLPELAVTLSALRLGALDMAIGNLLGSNLFNLLILAVDDVFYWRGPLLSHVSATHAISVMSALTMTGAVIVGLLYRPPGRLFRTVGWISVLLLWVYVLNAYVLFRFGG
ncbi:MAG: cation transporter [Betaproteobacteria bacterium RBG_16_64_18]|nr:MAG: cation transporter [Betaproteobacteria bacterium RBG_16_64_18]